MPENATYGRAMCVCIDAEGYSGRVDPDQADVQTNLAQLVRTAGRAATLNLRKWGEQHEGDGMLIVTPLDATEPRYIDDFVEHLDTELSRVNRNRTPQARIRLRVSMNVGVAYPGPLGWVGDGVILAKRLINAGAVRTALAAVPANLVLALSSGLYADLVAADHTRLAASDFTRVDIEEEKINTEAWLWAGRGTPPQPVRRAPEPATRGAAASRNWTIQQRAETVYNVQEVHGQSVHLGAVVHRAEADHG